MNLTSPAEVKRILNEHRLRPKKRLGQSFLIDRNVLNRIVEESGAGSGINVLEIGAGMGVLTCELARRADRVVCVETDAALRPVLEESLHEFTNVEITVADFLKLDLPRLIEERGGSWVVVGNLPYYITTPTIVKLIDSKHLFSDVLVMVQREVADRLVSPPGSGDYGSITVLVQYHFEIRAVARVSRNVFYPAPEVDSEIVKLTPRKQPPVAVQDEALMFRIVRAAFGKRRKMLANALSSSEELGWDRARADEVLTSAGIDPSRRGETLSIAEFAAIADAAVQRA